MSIIKIIIIVSLIVGLVWLGFRSCTPKPPVIVTITPTVTNTKIATLEPTFIATKTKLPTATFTKTPKPTKTATLKPTSTPTKVPTLTPTKDYCWWNSYFEMIVCYPRLHWHPAR
jgi:hypothetical protein